MLVVAAHERNHHECPTRTCGTECEYKYSAQIHNVEYLSRRDIKDLLEGTIKKISRISYDGVRKR